MISKEDRDKILAEINKYPAYMTLGDLLPAIGVILNALTAEDVDKATGVPICGKCNCAPCMCHALYPEDEPVYRIGDKVTIECCGMRYHGTIQDEEADYETEQYRKDGTKQRRKDGGIRG